jgi:hypothetical protein
LESQQPANKLDQSLNRALRWFYILIQNPLTVSNSRLLSLGLHSEFGIAAFVSQLRRF